MKRMSLLIAFFVIGSLIAETCDARGRIFRRRRRARTTYRYVSHGTASYGWNSGTDYQRAYAKAKYMHENRIYAHVGIPIGFEGWGAGGPNCPTCVPSGRMTLTADAHYGNIRVRVWR